MKKWMKKLIVFMLAIAFVVGVDSCRHKGESSSNDEIYKAKDCAVAAFEDTMPEEYTIVTAKGNVGEDRKDSIYEITLTYTIGEDDEHFSYWYKISVEENDCTILEEKPCD